MSPRRTQPLVVFPDTPAPTLDAGTVTLTFGKAPSELTPVRLLDGSLAVHRRSKAVQVYEGTMNSRRHHRLLRTGIRGLWVMSSTSPGEDREVNEEEAVTWLIEHGYIYHPLVADREV